MTEEEKAIEAEKSVTGEQSGDEDYIAAIKELKEKSVDRTQYDALRAENKRLLDALVNGSEPERAKPKADVDELRKRVFKEDQTNLEFAENALALREAIIDQGGTDPFLPAGKKCIPTNEDVEAAGRVAAVLQECIDYAEGDSQIFTNELMRRTVDAAPAKAGQRSARK